MKIHLLVAFAIAATGTSTFAQEYAASAIPEALKTNAHAVVRRYDESFTITEKDKATHRIHKVYTILSEGGKRFATEPAFYDKLSRIVSFEGAIYGADGKLIKKLRKADVRDQSAISGFSLYEDNRVKWTTFVQGNYPYTVEFNIKTEFNYLFFLPEFTPVSQEKVSVQSATYTVRFRRDLEPRFKEINMPSAAVRTSDELENVMFWEVVNLPAVMTEPYGPPLSERLPRVIGAPGVFKFDRYEGTMKNWDTFGKWINDLNADRGELSTQTKAKVKELTAGVTDTEQKARILYKHMQDRTRYVSIQLGIGGFQPFPASVVDETGYGDCKALSNYMVALLKEAGVTSNYTLIRAGKNSLPIETDFASSQFNHAIVMIPNAQDTLWLECTSQTNPFGYQGSFTGDRKALIITPNGAEVVSTTPYDAEINRQERNAEVLVSLDGNATAKVSTTYSGIQYENGNLNFMLDGSKDDLDKWVYNNTFIPSFDLKKYETKHNKSRVPSATVNMDLILRKYATVSGKRLFVTPNLMNRNSSLPSKVTNRTTDVSIRTGFVDVDSITLQFPEQIYPESLPSDIAMTTPFGEYRSTFKIESGRVQYVRYLKMRKGRYPPDKYKDLVEFYQNINKADNAKIVFLTKT